MTNKNNNLLREEDWDKKIPIIEKSNNNNLKYNNKMKNNKFKLLKKLDNQDNQNKFNKYNNLKFKN